MLASPPFGFESNFFKTLEATLKNWLSSWFSPSSTVDFSPSLLFSDSARIDHSFIFSHPLFPVFLPPPSPFLSPATPAYYANLSLGGIFPRFLCLIFCTLYIPFCTLSVLFCTLSVLSCTFYIPFCTLSVLFCSLSIPFCTLYFFLYTPLFL